MRGEHEGPTVFWPITSSSWDLWHLSGQCHAFDCSKDEVIYTSIQSKFPCSRSRLSHQVVDKHVRLLIWIPSLSWTHLLSPWNMVCADASALNWCDEWIYPFNLKFKSKRLRAYGMPSVTEEDFATSHLWHAFQPCLLLTVSVSITDVAASTWTHSVLCINEPKWILLMCTACSIRGTCQILWDRPWSEISHFTLKCSEVRHSMLVAGAQHFWVCLHQMKGWLHKEPSRG